MGPPTLQEGPWLLRSVSILDTLSPNGYREVDVLLGLGRFRKGTGWEEESCNVPIMFPQKALTCSIVAPFGARPILPIEVRRRIDNQKVLLASAGGVECDYALGVWHGIDRASSFVLLLWIDRGDFRSTAL